MAEESRASLPSRFGGTVAVTPKGSTGNPSGCNRPPPRGCPTTCPTPDWKGVGFVGPIYHIRLVLDPSPARLALSGIGPPSPEDCNILGTREGCNIWGMDDFGARSE